MVRKDAKKGDAVVLAMPGTPHEQRHFIERLLRRVDDGEIRLVMLLTIDSGGDVGYEWSGPSSALERAGLLATIQHQTLRAIMSAEEESQDG